VREALCGSLRWHYAHDPEVQKALKEAEDKQPK
jgi:hypothetical protein